MADEVEYAKEKFLKTFDRTTWAMIENFSLPFKINPEMASL